MEVDDAVERLVGAVGLLLRRDPVLHGARGSCPRWISPVGWMPENTRGMGRDTTRGAPVAPDVDCRGRSAAGTLDPDVVRGPHARSSRARSTCSSTSSCKQEVELWEVSLAEIVDAYLAELDRMDSFDLDVATEFLLIAATLVELKARRLLPGIDDARARRGAAALRGARPAPRPAARVQDVQGRRRAPSRAASAGPTAACPRTAGPEEPYRWMAPDPLERVRPDALRAAALRVLAAPPDRRGRHRPRGARCAPASATRSSRCSGCCPSRSP